MPIKVCDRDICTTDRVSQFNWPDGYTCCTNASTSGINAEKKLLHQVKYRMQAQRALWYLRFGSTILPSEVGGPRCDRNSILSVLCIEPRPLLEECFKHWFLKTAFPKTLTVLLKA